MYCPDNVYPRYYCNLLAVMPKQGCGGGRLYFHVEALGREYL
ncbi:hypothetical protein Plhal703r1_c42g0142691 [Plasmopara halstedii]